MTCAEFLEHFSDYVDDGGNARIVAEARAHRDTCLSCRRYEDTWRRGLAVLSEGGETDVELDADFHARLQHRLYSVDDRRAAERYGSSRGVLAAAALVAGLVFVGTVVPPLVERPEVALAPIVVDRPALRPLGLRWPVKTVLPRGLEPRPLELRGEDLWDRPSDLFFEYAPVHSIRRAASSTRLVLE